MNKSDLIQIVAQKQNIPFNKAKEVVEHVFDRISETIVRGGRIEFRGLGVFTVREYTSYTGRDPRTGQPVQVDPKRLPYFKVSKELKRKIDRYGK